MLGPAGSPIQIYGMATFDARVLEISLVNVAKMLHAHLYMYVLAFTPSGVSVATPSDENTLERSNVSGP